MIAISSRPRLLWQATATATADGVSIRLDVEYNPEPWMQISIDRDTLGQLVREWVELQALKGWGHAPPEVHSLRRVLIWADLLCGTEDSATEALEGGAS